MTPTRQQFRIKALGILWFLLATFVLQPLAGAWHVAGHDDLGGHHCGSGHTHHDGVPYEDDTGGDAADTCGLCQAFAAAAQAHRILTETPSWQFLTVFTVSTTQAVETFVSTQRLPTRARSPPSVA